MFRYFVFIFRKFIAIIRYTLFCFFGDSFDPIYRLHKDYLSENIGDIQY